MTTTNKPSILYWIIAIVLGFLWNLYGVYLFIYETFLATPETLAAVYTEEQVAFLSNTPTWVTILYGIATITGFLGAIMLLMKKKLAIPLFGISLIAILINMIYGWFVAKSPDVMGPVLGYAVPVTVIVVGLILYFYSKGAAKKGWIS